MGEGKDVGLRHLSLCVRLTDARFCANSISETSSLKDTNVHSFAQTENWGASLPSLCPLTPHIHSATELSQVRPPQSRKPVPSPSPAALPPSRQRGAAHRQGCRNHIGLVLQTPPRIRPCRRPTWCSVGPRRG